MEKKYFLICKHDLKDGYVSAGPNVWSCISDIGKLVTKEEYLKVESKYILFIIELLEKFNYEGLKLIGIENYIEDYEEEEEYMEIGDKELILSIEEKQFYSLGIVEKLLRIFLRSIIWGRLYGRKIEIKTGYDYQIYLVTNDEKIFNYLKNIKDDILFVKELNFDVFKVDDDYKEHTGYTEDHFYED